MCVVNSYYVGASFMCARLYVRVPKAINHDQLDCGTRCICYVSVCLFLRPIIEHWLRKSFVKLFPGIQISKSIQ